MRDSAVIATSGSRRYRVGGLLAVIGIILAGLGLFGDVSSDDVPGGAAGVVGVAAFLVFIGVAMLSPFVARPVAAVPRLGARVAARDVGGARTENAMRNPRRTATTASALMIGLALVTLVSIIGASAKQSFEQIIDDSVRADFLVQGKGFINRGFTPRSPTRCGRSSRARRSCSSVRASSSSTVTSDQLLGVSPNVEDAIDIQLRPSADLDAFANGGVFVNKDTANDKGWKVGDTIEMQFEKTGVQPERSRASSTRTVDRHDYLLSLQSYEANYVDQTDSLVAVRKPPGVSRRRRARRSNRC